MSKRKGLGNYSIASLINESSDEGLIFIIFFSKI